MKVQHVIVKDVFKPEEKVFGLLKIRVTYHGSDTEQFLIINGTYTRGEFGEDFFYNCQLGKFDADKLNAASISLESCYTIQENE